MNSHKKIIRRILNRMGFSIDRIPPQSRSLMFCEYEAVYPEATYSPWNSDRDFFRTYKSIRNCTKVDIYRCYELWQLVKQSSKLKKGCLVEVGVWRGGTGGLIAKQAYRTGISEKVFLCDTFCGVVKAGIKDSAYCGGEHSDANPSQVEALLRERLKLDNVEILMGVFPDETGIKLADEQVRFCHIDVDVYQSAKDVLTFIWPKIVPGGIVVFDDYGFQYCNGITKLVNECFDSSDRLSLHNLNGHAVMIKIDD